MAAVHFFATEKDENLLLSKVCGADTCLFFRWGKLNVQSPTYLDPEPWDLSQKLWSDTAYWTRHSVICILLPTARPRRMWTRLHIDSSLSRSALSTGMHWHHQPARGWWTGTGLPRFSGVEDVGVQMEH